MAGYTWKGKLRRQTAVYEQDSSLCMGTCACVCLKTNTFTPAQNIALKHIYLQRMQFEIYNEHPAFIYIDKYITALVATSYDLSCKCFVYIYIHIVSERQAGGSDSKAG